MKSNMETVWSDVPEKQARDRQYGPYEVSERRMQAKRKMVAQFCAPSHRYP